MLPVQQQGVIKLNWWGFCLGLVAELNEGQHFSELSSSALKSLTDLPQITSSPVLQWDWAAKSCFEPSWRLFIDFTVCVLSLSKETWWLPLCASACLLALSLLAFFLHYESGKQNCERTSCVSFIRFQETRNVQPNGVWVSCLGKSAPLCLRSFHRHSPSHLNHSVSVLPFPSFHHVPLTSVLFSTLLRMTAWRWAMRMCLRRVWTRYWPTSLWWAWWAGGRAQLWLWPDNDGINSSKWRKKRKKKELAEGS